jgi:hypothetical protein
MQRLPRRTVLANVLAAAVLARAGATPSRAQEASPTASSAATPTGPSHAALLPREVILPLNEVQEVLPEMEVETATGENAGAIGDPVATRSVTYATEDGELRLVLSMDRHRSATDASAAFAEAAAQSEVVPGVDGEAVPDLGEEGFVGVVTQGDETHFGGGARFGDLIVNATMQGYDATEVLSIALVAELIYRQVEHAEQVLQPAASPTATG